ncbi:hypothetical protein ACRXCV_09360 [Halobacteriovorax sp. GFR7]|uniref:hypothetical protein n=1 Tax=unclassified Halobacteriovorax TaxID=2639665 RepID=UPI003D96AE62
MKVLAALFIVNLLTFTNAYASGCFGYNEYVTSIRPGYLTTAKAYRESLQIKSVYTNVSNIVFWAQVNDEKVFFQSKFMEPSLAQKAYDFITNKLDETLELIAQFNEVEFEIYDDCDDYREYVTRNQYVLKIDFNGYTAIEFKNL